MGCGNCSSGGCSTTPGGCGSKGCATGGCNKLNTYDWFGNMQQPYESETENIYEIRFKNTRKQFFKNVNGLSLVTGDMVVVESDRGHDVGQISLGGILAKLQLKKRKRSKGKPDPIRKIYRRATNEDIEKLKEARAREKETLLRSRVIVNDLDLDMKVSDVEYQGDNTKAIFYYIADKRVDFRKLIKVLAEVFRIRVEMKQIGLRHEAGLVGGIGSCGRELCCSTWLTDFKTVSTSAARYQNLSLNPMKISGQCGRLKCCLNYELETYLDAIKDIPNINKIDTDMGIGYHQKTDIFKRIMWFSYEGESNWIALPVEHVNEMVEMNKAGKRPASLRALETEVTDVPVDFVDVVGGMDFADVNKKLKRKKRKPKGKRKGPRNQNQQNTKGRNQPQNRRKKSGGKKKSGNQGGEDGGQNKSRPPKNQRRQPRGKKGGPKNVNKGGDNKQSPKNDGPKS